MRSAELSGAFVGRRGLLATIIGMSALLNILLLSGALFMMLVYDSVLPSRSTPSLVGLVFIVVVAFGFQALIEHLRNRVMSHVGEVFENSLAKRVFAVTIDSELQGGGNRNAPQPVRDLGHLRNFLSGAGPMALLDLPWMFLFLGILFAFHALLGVVTLVGVLLLIIMTVWTDRMTNASVDAATKANAERHAFVDACRRNAEVIRALGMKARSTQGWTDLSGAHETANESVAGTIGAMRTFSKTFRMLLQSLILACGAWLVIHDQASAGVIIASSILSARAIAPIELAIANWRGFISSRQAWNRLAQTLASNPPLSQRTTLPVPKQGLKVENLAAIAPGSQFVLFRDVNFAVSAGDTLAIIGPSGSGKSSLAKTLVGVFAPARGAVRLDGAALDQWDADSIGQHIGYLPQDIELFDGSVAQNIARFDPTAKSEEIIKAAQDANVHELIVQLPDGYDTILGSNGRNLSAGQRQRVALARALFRDPFLIVLDEPNSNLDSDGDLALDHAIAKARDRGAIVIIVAHRPSALSEIATLLWLNAGVVKAFGAKKDILSKLTGAQQPEARPTNAHLRAAT